MRTLGGLVISIGMACAASSADISVVVSNDPSTLSSSNSGSYTMTVVRNHEFGCATLKESRGESMVKIRSLQGGFVGKFLDLASNYYKIALLLDRHGATGFGERSARGEVSIADVYISIDSRPPVELGWLISKLRGPWPFRYIGTPRPDVWLERLKRVLEKTWLPGCRRTLKVAASSMTQRRSM